MGIKLDNLDEQVITLKAGEPVAADDHVDSDFANFDHFIKNIHVQCGVVGATGTTAVDILKNLATILASSIDLTADLIPTSYPDLVAGAQVGAKGDRYSLNIDTVETTPPQGLSVQMVLARKRPGPLQNVTPANLK